MEIVIVGGGFGGVQAAIACRKDYPQAQITLVEKEARLGFVPGSLHLILQNPDLLASDLQWVTPEKLTEQYKINVRMNTTSLGLVDYHHLKVVEGSLYFDYLIIATGSAQSGKLLVADGNAEEYSFKSPQAFIAVLEKIKAAQKIAIVGGGQVGLELANSLAGKKEVHLFEKNDSLVFHHLDGEFSEPIVAALKKADIHPHLSSFVETIRGDGVLRVETGKGRSFFDCVLLANSTRPDNHYWQPWLAVNDDGTLKVDDYLRTSQKHIFAVGDAIQTKFRLTGEAMYVALVNNAQRTAKIAAANLLENKQVDTGSLRVIGNHWFGYYVGSVGLTEKEAIFYPNPVQSYFVTETSSLAKGQPLQMKLLVDQESQEILGGQLLSKVNIFSYLDLLTLAIDGKWQVADLAEKEWFFQPAYRPVRNLFQQVEDLANEN